MVGQNNGMFYIKEWERGREGPSYDKRKSQEK